MEIARKVADSFERTLAEATPILEHQLNQNNNQNIVNQNDESMVQIEVPEANNFQRQGENTLENVNENEKVIQNEPENVNTQEISN